MKTCPFKHDTRMFKVEQPEEVLYSRDCPESIGCYKEPKIKFERMDYCDEEKCALWDAELGRCAAFERQESKHTSDSEDVLSLTTALIKLNGTYYPSFDSDKIQGKIENCLNALLEKYYKELKK